MNDLHYDKLSAETSTQHHRRSNASGLWVGLFGAPLAWIAQVSLSEPIAAHACYPYQAPLPAPIWNDLPAILAGISIVCLAAALLSGFIALTLWRRFEENLAGENHPEIDRVNNRKRFLLHLSAMSSLLFTIAIVFNICAIWLVAPCSSWF